MREPNENQTATAESMVQRYRQYVAEKKVLGTSFQDEIQKLREMGYGECADALEKYVMEMENLVKKSAL